MRASLSAMAAWFATPTGGRNTSASATPSDWPRPVSSPRWAAKVSAYYFADLLYEAGLPVEMLQVVTGEPREIANELLTHPYVDLVTFTGGVSIGKHIASKAGYRRIVLELGGNDPLIVMDDADLDKASDLAVQGSYKNSGQRCTAVKRMLVHEKVLAEFTERVVAKTKAWRYGDPMHKANDMGTVIDEAAARHFEKVVNEAIAQGARLLTGNVRDGALYSPTVLDNVRPEMTVVRGCAEFCVNGQSTAGASRPVRKHNEHQETRRT